MDDDREARRGKQKKTMQKAGLVLGASWREGAGGDSPGAFPHTGARGGIVRQRVADPYGPA